MMDLTRRCEQCGAEIDPMAHPRRTFCSKKCNNDHFNGLAAQALAEARAGRVCPECGGPVANHKKADAVFCSTACWQASYNRRKREARR